MVGGTSAGAPQWAALCAIDPDINLANLYAASSRSFHSISHGTNGDCGSDCTAKTGYDLVTGLGSSSGLSF